MGTDAMNLFYPGIVQLEKMQSLKTLPATYYSSGKITKHPDSRVDRTAKPKVMAARLAVLPHEFDVKLTAKLWKLQNAKSSHSRINILKAEGLVEPTGMKINNYMQYRKTQLAYTFEQQYRCEDE